MKRRVRIIIPVDFYADSKKGLEDAIKEYLRDPCWGSDGCGELGLYGWKQGRAYRLKTPPDAEEPR